MELTLSKFSHYSNFPTFYFLCQTEDPKQFKLIFFKVK
jgi:hypothetical protein